MKEEWGGIKKRIMWCSHGEGKKGGGNEKTQSKIKTNKSLVRA